MPTRALRNSIIALVIIALVLVLSQRLFWRMDLTEDRLYTLNDASIQLLDELEEPLHIKVYFSEKLPTRFQPIANFLKTLLDEYASHGNGKVQITYLDPAARIEEVDEAHRLGIYETKANVTEKNRMEMVHIWFGLALLYEDRKEIFPSVASVENFEYDISSAIVRLLSREKPKVGFMGPTYAGEAALTFEVDGGMKMLTNELSALHEVVPLYTDEGKAPDLEPIDVLYAWGLHQFNEAQLYALDQYIMRGKPLVLTVSGVRVDPAQLKAERVTPGLADEFMAHLGFVVNRDLVCDQVCTKVKYNAKPPVLKEYPLFPTLYKERGGLDQDVEPTASLNSLVIPWGSTLEPNPKSGIEIRVTARTSAQSWLQTNKFQIDPRFVPGPYSFDTYVVGLQLNGYFSSFYKTAPLPTENHLSKAQKEGAIHVWSAEQMLTQANNPSIPAMLRQTADFMTFGHKLSGIDRRDTAFRPLKAMSDEERKHIKLMSVCLVPLIILLLGFARLFYRKTRVLTQYTD